MYLYPASRILYPESIPNNQYSMLTPTTQCKTPLPLWLKDIEQGTRNLQQGSGRK